jgi:hypothetical protein
VRPVGGQRAVGDAPFQDHAQRLALRTAGACQRIHRGVPLVDVREDVQLARGEEHHRRSMGERDLLELGGAG